MSDNGHAGTFALLSGIFHHPVRALHMIGHRAHAMVRPLITSGLAGILSPIGLLVAVSTLIPAALAISPSFSSVNDSFQTLPVVPFLLVGDAIVLLRLGEWASRSRSTSSRWARAARSRSRSRSPGSEAVARRRLNRSALIWGMACLLAAAAVVQDERLVIHLRQTWWTVSPSAAVALHTGLDKAPASAEVISSNGVIGRFSQRRYAYPLQLSPQTVPVKATHVILVIASAGNEALTTTQVAADVRFARNQLHAREVSHAEGVTTFQWNAPSGQRNVTFP